MKLISRISTWIKHTFNPSSIKTKKNDDGVLSELREDTKQLSKELAEEKAEKDYLKARIVEKERKLEKSREIEERIVSLQKQKKIEEIESVLSLKNFFRSNNQCMVVGYDKEILGWLYDLRIYPSSPHSSTSVFCLALSEFEHGEGRFFELRNLMGSSIEDMFMDAENLPRDIKSGRVEVRQDKYGNIIELQDHSSIEEEAMSDEVGDN